MWIRLYFSWIYLVSCPVTHKMMSNIDYVLDLAIIYLWLLKEKESFVTSIKWNIYFNTMQIDFVSPFWVYDINTFWGQFYQSLFLIVEVRIDIWWVMKNGMIGLKLFWWLKTVAIKKFWFVFFRTLLWFLMCTFVKKFEHQCIYLVLFISISICMYLFR